MKKLFNYSVGFRKYNTTVMKKVVTYLLTVILFFTGTLHVNAQKKYNVIFINMDDMSIAFNMYRNTGVATPNIQRLAQHGVSFRNVYAQYSLCSPSRTSMFSGKRVRTTKITENITPLRTYMDSNYHFVNEYFHDFGYRTESYGKFSCNHDDEISWDVYFNAVTGGDGGLQNDDDQEGTGISSKPLSINAGRQEPIWFVDTLSKTVFATEDGKETNRFLKAIDTLSYKPYFLNLGLQTHNPFTPMLQYWNKIGDPLNKELLPVDSNFVYTNVYGNGSGNIALPDSPPNDTLDIPAVALKQPFFYTDSATQRVRHAYYAEMIQADSLIGAVLDKLDAKNLWDSSVVVFWSDHGLSMGEHTGQWLKLNMFEEALRVPMIICAPGRQKGVWCNQPVELVDVFQTLTELCGLPPQGSQEGSSIVPLLDNPNFLWKKCIFSNLKKNLNLDTLLGTAVRTNLWHYNNWQEGGEELYNMATDSTEITNLALNPAYIDTLNKMRSLAAGDWQGAVPPVYKKKTFYRDADGDGYGKTSDSLWAYALPAGYVLKKGDCNDTKPNINPGATENACNGADDNCNNQIDENRPVPTVTANGSLDICATGRVTLTTNSSTDFSYQWKKNNVNIAGATQKSYTANSVGTYTVLITHINGCSNTSAGTAVYSSCFYDAQIAKNGLSASPATKLSLYPNPSTGITTISFTTFSAGKLTINIYNSAAQTVYTQLVNAVAGNNSYELDLSHIKPGVYQVEAGNSQHVKLIVER